MSTLSSQLVLLRHGETRWSAGGHHTGRADLPLTRDGEAQAVAAGRLLADGLARRGRTFAQVRTSPLQRARRTAELAGYPDAALDPDLAEWDYGPVEGRTSEQMSAALGRPWQIFEDGVQVATGLPAPEMSPGDHAVGLPSGLPAGETLADVAARAARVLAAVEPVLARDEDVLLVAHGHLLRILGVLWLGLEPAAAARFELGTAATCLLGYSHGQHSVEGWNLVSWGR